MFNSLIKLDVAYPWIIGFQDGSTPTQEGIVELHNTIMFFLIILFVLVFWVLGSVMWTYNSKRVNIVHKYLNHGTTLELVWTITPALILVAIAFPSFQLLYMLDEVISPTITIKAMGSQWFWSYEYSDFLNKDGESIEFDSYIKAESDLELGEYRMLDVDNSVVIPVDTHIRFIVSANDVLHDWAVPALGVKLDACPGRLNQISVLVERESTAYGQCSELCGAYHGMMPIAVEAINLEGFLQWLDSMAN